MGQIDTFPSQGATQYQNTKRLDRTSDGKLWYYQVPPNGVLAHKIYSSSDGGTTWAVIGTFNSLSGSTVQNVASFGSMFIDMLDVFHFTYNDQNTGNQVYVRGTTTSTARTAFNAFSQTSMVSGTNYFGGDIVAFPDPARAGGAFLGYIICPYRNGSSACLMLFRVNITAGGSVTTTLVGDVGVNMSTSSPPQNANYKLGSLDFRHNGDGKTPVMVSGAYQPDVYIAYSTGYVSGSSYGMRFVSAIYTGQDSWSHYDAALDASSYINGPDSGFVTCMFDGTRVVVAMTSYDNTNGGQVTQIFDAPPPVNSATFTRRYRGTVITTSGATGAVWRGCGAYDTAKGDVYLIGSPTNGIASLGWWKWERATGTFSGPTTVDSNLQGVGGYPNARRGSQGQAIDYAYTAQAPSNAIIGTRISLNRPPTATTPTSPADAAAWNSEVANNLVFTHNDPDGDAASAYRVRYRPAGTSAAYQYLTGTTTAANGASVTVPVAAGVWVGAIEYASQTYDPSNTEGAWSATRTVTALPATLTAATGGQGGTSLHAQAIYNTTQNDRAMRALSLV